MPLTTYLADHPEKKYLIFDFDETLFHIHVDWKVYTDRQLAFLKTVDPELVRELSNKGNALTMIDEFIVRYGQRVYPECMRIAAEVEKSELQAVHQNKPLVEWLRQYHHTYHCFVWSSNCKSTILPVFEELKITEFFDEVVCRDMVLLAKPYPDGFALISKKAQELSGSQPPQLSEFVMIGDSQKDEGAAKAAGIDYLYHKFSVPYEK